MLLLLILIFSKPVVRDTLYSRVVCLHVLWTEDSEVTVDEFKRVVRELSELE